MQGMSTIATQTPAFHLGQVVITAAGRGWVSQIGRDDRVQVVLDDAPLAQYRSNGKEFVTWGGDLTWARERSWYPVADVTVVPQPERVVTDADIQAFMDARRNPKWKAPSLPNASTRPPRLPKPKPGVIGVGDTVRFGDDDQPWIVIGRGIGIGKTMHVQSTAEPDLLTTVETQALHLIERLGAIVES